MQYHCNITNRFGEKLKLALDPSGDMFDLLEAHRSALTGGLLFQRYPGRSIQGGRENSLPLHMDGYEGIGTNPGRRIWIGFKQKYVTELISSI